MEFSEVLKRRRMVRHFTDEPVDDAAAESIVNAALRAPSAGYSQGYALLVLRDAADRDRFWTATAVEDSDPAGWDADVAAGVRRAQLLVVALSSKDVYLDRYARPDKGWADRDEARWPVPYWDVDAGFLALLMLLAAVDRGLGALLFGMTHDQLPGFRAEFGIPDSHRPVGVVAVGHPDPSVPPRNLRARRRPREELVHVGRW